MSNCIDEIIYKLEMSQKFTSENLRIILNDYSISRKETSLVVVSDKKERAVQMFLVTKKVEGCADNTLTYYIGVLSRFFTEIKCELDKIGADQIRYYIAVRSQRDKLSKVSQDNELRVLRSFFKWASLEDYITKNPTANIKAIKQDKRIKKPFSEVELELLRNAARSYKRDIEAKRNIAIVEMLYSTGCRVSELCGMNRQDINNDEVVVLGKGGKERVCYLNAKAILALEDYINARSDSNPALFVSVKKPYKRVTKSGVEYMTKRIGKIADVADTHPHRFRRTAATTALNRGMPIDQVQQMLGHEQINTTTIYARSKQDNVKASHRKYVV